MNLQERKKYSRLVELVNRRFESRFYPKLQKAIKQDISSLIEYLKINGIDSAPKYFDDNIASKSLTEIVQDLYSNVGVYHANRVYRDLRKEEKGFGFNPDFINFVTNYFRKHLVEKITFGAVKTMRDFFLPLISKAVTDGATFEEIAQAIRDKGFEKRQAARIVRTEVNSATNVAAVAAAEKFEYKTMKEWISGHDHRVRGRNPEDHANHWGLDGVIIDYEDYFIDPRNKVQLFQPGDPKARGLSRDVAATTINCRCTVALVAKRDANDRLIPKTGLIKSVEPEETKELKPDYSEIIEPIDYLKDEIRDIGRDVRGIKETDLSPVLERFEGLATKEDLDEIKLFGELISGEGERQVEVVTKVRDELERLIEEKLNGDLSRIDELIDLINSKDYKPEITLQHDSKDVKDGVESLRVELLLLINSRFDGLLKEITKKKKWKFDVVKDSDDLIISATAQQV